MWRQLRPAVRTLGLVEDMQVTRLFVAAKPTDVKTGMHERPRRDQETTLTLDRFGSTVSVVAGWS